MGGCFGCRDEIAAQAGSQVQLRGHRYVIMGSDGKAFHTFFAIAYPRDAQTPELDEAVRLRLSDPWRNSCQKSQLYLTNSNEGVFHEGGGPTGGAQRGSASQYRPSESSWHRWYELASTGTPGAHTQHRQKSQ